MEWQARRQYFQPSANGRYTVSAARIPEGIVYTTWRCEQPVAKALGHRDNAQACRALCEADAARLDGHASPEQSAEPALAAEAE